jgi:serine/threonine protein kinase
MTLSAGTRLGPYEILSPLGAGGMGEVYRARDTRLARDVAIKVLPEALASDQERLRRFESAGRKVPDTTPASIFQQPARSSFAVLRHSCAVLCSARIPLAHLRE